jgi:hypothetical protein
MQANDRFDSELMDWIHSVFFGHVLSSLRLELFHRNSFLRSGPASVFGPLSAR